MVSSSSPGRRRVVEALWRTIARAGVAGISVRTVAAEAGVTGGTVQHHFPTRGEMIRFAMELIAEQVEERLVAMPRTGPVPQWTRQILLELLPLGAARRQEFNIWLAFTVHAATDPDLTELKRQTSARLLQLNRNIARARWGGTLAATESTIAGPAEHAAVDLEQEAILLQAVIDGLSLHLAEMDIEEAAIAGPRLLDQYLASVDQRLHRLE
ncbi:MAG TPA: TetR family transcriptional regulator C-terminal domain-containing protein [Beutenbergiaceae bacterium]|nr:TetR family transcriptional regulator C-terminal domain-containing protein [Beutenbergiaceae bacterium]